MHLRPGRKSRWPGRGGKRGGEKQKKNFTPEAKTSDTEKEGSVQRGFIRKGKGDKKKGGGAMKRILKQVRGRVRRGGGLDQLGQKAKKRGEKGKGKNVPGKKRNTKTLPDGFIQVLCLPKG